VTSSESGSSGGAAMFIRHSVQWHITLSAMLASLILAGCGGGSSPAPDPQGNPVNPGGAQGNLNNGGNLPVNPADVPVAHEITAAWPEAPLGTNPAFNVRPAGADVVSRTASKSGSE